MFSNGKTYGFNFINMMTRPNADTVTTEVFFCVSARCLAWILEPLRFINSPNEITIKHSQDARCDVVEVYSCHLG